MSRSPNRLGKVVIWMKPKDGGQALLRWRKRAGLTQRELAMLAKCSHTAIYKLENGLMLTLSDKLADRIVRRLPGAVLEDVFEPRSLTVLPTVSTGKRDIGRKLAGVA